VLYDLAAVVEAEDVDAGIIFVAGPLLMAMQHDMVSLGDHALEVHALARILPGHPLEVLDERLLAIGHLGIVLSVGVCGVLLDGFSGLALVEHQVVERLDGLLVPLQAIVQQLLSVSIWPA